jgi:formylglycine-generating enzyme required for sulfatase activity
MAYALDELYTIANQRGDHLMSSADYEGLGGVQGAIGKRAESTFGVLPGALELRKACMQRVFRELIEVDERGVATRRRALLSDVARDEQDRAFIHAFVAARLLTTSEGEGGGQLEVAHEALLRSWIRLVHWIESVQSDLLLLRQMRVAASEWGANARHHDYLWLGERGSEAKAMLARLQPVLGDVETEFARPEADHLIDELQLSRTTHFRREAIGQRLLILTDRRRGVGCEDGSPNIQWCYVDVGETDSAEFHDHQNKSFGVFKVHSFYIAKFPVTSAQFHSFVEAKEGMSKDAWWMDFEEPTRELQTALQQGANYPRDSVNWYLAVAYCRWLNATMPTKGLPEMLGSRDDWGIRLPHEWEWQWAAGGGSTVAPFPWGNWDPSRCNLKEAGIGRTVAVGLYPDGAAPCGAMDMIGNVREWCLNTHKDASHIAYQGTKPRALRGGSIYQDHLRSFASYRASMGPGTSSREAGFRLVYAPSLRFGAPLQE